MYSGSYDTDTCQSPNCGSVLTASSSNSQGQKFQALTKNYHGGRRRTLRRMRGGAVDYPSQFSEVLPVDLHNGARITSLDSAFSQLPAFAGKYGMQGGRGGRTRGCRHHHSRSRHTRRRRPNRNTMRGGMAPIQAPTWFLTPKEEGQAFLNPQFYTENQVVPSFKGPDNSYVQKAGTRASKRRR